MTVTGSTSYSRLNELRKYAITNVFADKYIGDGSAYNDGVNYYESIEGQMIVYYLGGIRYVDYIGTTTGITFSYIPQSTSSPDFIDVPIMKNPNKEGIISYPETNNDVFIVRQELPAFDSNYRLEYITNLGDLESYAGGKFFNIVSNT